MKMRKEWNVSRPSRAELWVTWLAIAGLVSAAGCARSPAAKRQKFMEAGNRYYGEQHYSEAVIEYKNAIQVDPRFAGGYYRLGLGLLAEGQAAPAAQALMQTVNLDPKNIDARLRLGDILLAATQYSDATTQAEEVLKLDPKNANAFILLGQVAFQKRKYADAKGEFEQAVEVAPNDPAPYGNLALAQLISQEFDAAEKNFQKAVQLKPGDPQAVINLANFYRSRRDPMRAEQVLREGMAQNPKAVAIPLAIADLYVYQGRAADATRLLVQVESDSARYPDGHRIVADFYFAHNDAASALDRYLAQADKGKLNPPLLKRIAECYLQLGRWSDAEQWIGKARKNSKDPDFGLLKARADLGEYRFRDAISEIQSVINGSPNLVAPRYYLAQAYFQEGDLNAAKGALTDAARIQPGYVPALLGLGDISLQQNDPDVALEYANELISQSYWMVDAHLIAGNAYILKHDVSSAQKEFQIATSLSPRNAVAEERLGRVLNAEGKYKEAEQAYEAALAANPSSADALSGLADNFVRQGRPAAARARIDQQIAAQPNVYQLQLTKGDFCFSRKDWSCSEQSYRRAIDLNPYAVNAYLALAQVYQQTNQFSQVIPEYEQARQKFPDYVPTYVLLGLAYESEGQYDKAKEAYQGALKVDPDFVPAQNDLAWLYVQHGGPLNEALALAQRAKARRPDDPHISDTLAWIYYKEGLYPSALALLEPAVAKNPKAPEFKFHLGMTYLAQGKSDIGRKTIEAALQEGLDQEDARTAREALEKAGS